jgi:hypothetical protein
VLPSSRPDDEDPAHIGVVSDRGAMRNDGDPYVITYAP